MYAENLHTPPVPVAKMNYDGHCVRVDARDGYLDKISALAICPDYTSMIAVKHLGKSKENPHYHLVVKTQVKDQAFRVRMKKVFDMGKGNQHMSIKPWDGSIDAISYLFHEDDTDDVIVCRKNITDETIAKAKERNRDVKTKIEAAKERASWKLEETLYQHIMSTTPTRTNVWGEHDLAKELVLLALRNDKYVPNDYQLKAMVTKLKFRLLKGNVRDEEEFATNYVNRVYRVQADLF